MPSFYYLPQLRLDTVQFRSNAKRGVLTFVGSAPVKGGTGEWRKCSANLLLPISIICILVPTFHTLWLFYVVCPSGIQESEKKKLSIL